MSLATLGGSARQPRQRPAKSSTPAPPGTALAVSTTPDSLPGPAAGEHSPGHSVSEPRSRSTPIRHAPDAPSRASGVARRLIGLPDAATMLGISRWTVRELVWRGTLPAVRLPGVRRRLIDVADLEALIAASKRA